MTEPGEPFNLKSKLYALSARAFVLAQDVERDRACASACKEEVMTLFQELDELRDAVRADPDRSLSQALSEAIADITYVLSGATAPMSMRLAYHVRAREAP
ncbi:MAG: hypothetical protein HUU14_02650 [Dehalococcoidia bacterium]|nr:hypothetical protein [Chloroflexi bacterium CFX7]MCK6564065.1 hypothetical protein [Dehalococcoidia bacterium]NUQ54765.1 hypothetical protein [Dehalococcoidia bacterium]